MAVPPVPEFPVRDLKLEALARLGQENWDIPRLEGSPLEGVATSFRANIATVRFMMSLPTSIVSAMALTQRCHDLAEFQVTGQLGNTLTEDENIKAALIAKEMLDKERNRNEELRQTPGWDGHVLDYHLNAARSLSSFADTPIGAYGFIPLLSGCITGTWTAIETMLADLWEAALNAHPRTLASLNGKPKKDADKNQYDKNPSDQDKKLDLNVVAKHGFDLRVHMGSILRSARRFEFARLSGAREAYMRAFSEKSSRVETAIANKSMDALSAVRNALLHRAAVADDEYVRQQKFLAIPKADKGERIRLDGQNTSDLIRPAIASSRSLMIAVDDWIREN
ncbi:hypothetical protein [Bradyrhizobium sp. CCBAU 53340]|uniref:hypothetical protein n=1 Tax=Bradyrhizobium sp. CCBAU 53340 TaxID=1325112 RepID=UPI00188A4FD9|nr:hypothetical protein [Bradyrhizobium sp. CCBAU 53340]